MAARRRGSRVLIGVFVLALVLPLVGPAAPATAAPGALAAQVDADAVLLRAVLQPDGTADWTVEYRIQLEDQNATDAFESLRADIRGNRSEFEAQFADRMRPTVAAAENATGRAMAIRGVSVTTSRQTLGQEYGVITYTFEWTNFAAIDGGRLVAGDALAGLFLDAETTLTVAWPSAYHVVTVRPAPTDTGAQSVTWAGRRDFASDEPVLVVEEGPASPTTQTTTDGGGPADGDGDRGTSTALIAVAGIAVIAVLGIAGWLYTRRRGTPDEPEGGSGPEDGPAPSTDLLSNEERVLQLLEERGGRMKQQQVADALDWTDAKTSQVVSSLREADEINSFRLGRENVLTLPDHDLTGSGEETDK